MNRLEELQRLFKETVAKRAVAKSNGEDITEYNVLLSALTAEIDLLERILGRLYSDF